MIPAVFSSEYVVPTPARNMLKLGFVAEQAQSMGLVRLIAPSPATREQLLLIHDQNYVDDFIHGRAPLCRSNNLPWSVDLVRSVLLMNGGMLTATEIAKQTGLAVNIANGFHHAGFASGEAYCTFNGLALVAAAHPEEDVFVLDADQHGGNGTEELTHRLPNLTTFSIHGSRFGCLGGVRSHFRTLRDAGADPTRLWDALDEAMSLAESASVVLYQAGMDCHEDDPHGSMGLTGEQLEQRDLRVATWARERGIPLVVTLAGGYQSLHRVVELHLMTLRALARVFHSSSTLSGPTRA